MGKYTHEYLLGTFTVYDNVGIEFERFEQGQLYVRTFH